MKMMVGWSFAFVLCLAPAVAKYIGSELKQDNNPDKRSDSEMDGRLAAVILIPVAIAVMYAAFMIVIGKYKEHNIIGFIQGPSYGYLSSLGTLLLLFSLLGLATTAGAHDRADHSTHPFDISYIKLLIAVNVLVFVIVASMMGLEYGGVVVAPKNILLVEFIMIVLTFSASVSAMDRFSSKRDYCDYKNSNLSACMAYHAGIFFTWTIFFLMLFKFIVHCMAMRNTRNQPNTRPNVTDPQQSNITNPSPLQQPMTSSSGVNPTVVQP